MKLTRSFLSLILLVGLAGVANAQIQGTKGGTIQMSWNVCSPIQQDVAAPTASPYGLVVSVTGHDIPHSAYQFWFLVGDQNNSLPEAWDFTAAGCEGSSFVTIDHLSPPALAKACPSFQGALQSLQIKAFQYSPPALGFPTTLGNGVLQNAYPAGQTTNVNPAATYFLGRFLFDFTYAVEGPGDPGLTCGGYESPMCLTFVPRKETWLDLDGLEWMFNGSNGANSWAVFRGGTGTCPGSVPAVNRTWGQIKDQYKR